MQIVEFLKRVQSIPLCYRKPLINDEDLEDLINQADMIKEDQRHNPYPILGSIPKQYIPYGLLMIHAGQALKNHGQSLEQLASRGGLSWKEALAIIEGKDFNDIQHDNNASEVIVRKMADDYMRGQPAANPIKYGRWISYLDGESIMPERYYQCSECGSRGYRKQYNYCAICGAKMIKV